MIKPTFLLRFYSLLMRCAAPLSPLYFERRSQQGKEDFARLPERYGIPSQKRPDGPLIWVHGASVGETTMAVPIIERLLKENSALNILITSGTMTSADMLAERLPDRAFHQYAPADVPDIVDKFLNHWTPDLCLWLESEIWPNTLRAAKKRDIPMALLNARLSEKSRNGWAKRPKTAKALFGAFDEILSVDIETAHALTDILGEDMPVFGNLKMGNPPLPVNADELKTIRSHITARKPKDTKIWCAASTHKGEEEIVLSAHKKIVEEVPDAVLILAPRHPERADEVINLIETAGFDYALWGQALEDTGSVYLMDRIGKMGLAYEMSDVVLLGGSLRAHLLGHNPIEVAQKNCAILTGPHVSSFENVYEPFFKNGAVSNLKGMSAENIGKHISHILADDELRAAMTAKAKKLSLESTHIMTRLFERLAPFLNALDDVE